MEGNFDFWRLLAGLGLFLFGMFLMEESVRKLAGRAFKRFIRDYTSNKWKAVGAGLASTAILQSSTAVSLMILAFVGAGVMEMANAIGVILGTNLGTTATGWLVASLGFKFKIESFALPMIGIGGLGIIFLGKSERYSNISKLVSGFGFIFLGLDYMKSGVEMLARDFDISQYQDLGVIVFFLVGVVLTVLIQSSSATMAIVMTALFSGILTFKAGAAIVVGANVGTTFTVLLGAIGSTQIKKRVAFSHLAFNTITGILALVMLPLFVWLIQDIMRLRDDPVLGLAAFHTGFNLVGICLFLPFIGLFSRGLVRLFPERIKELAVYLSNVDPNVAQAAIPALRKEVTHLTVRAMVHNLLFMKIDPRLVFSSSTQPGFPKYPEKAEADAEFEKMLVLQTEVFAFAAKIEHQDLQDEENEEITRILHAARLTIYATRAIRDVRQEWDLVSLSENQGTAELEQQFRKRMVANYIQVANILEGKATTLSPTPDELLEAIKDEDQAFVALAVKEVGKGNISESELPPLLLVNRGVYQSGKQVVQAWMELA